MTTLSATKSFSYTGAPDYFPVPPGCTSITVTVKGAAGGGATSGYGAQVVATLSVTPGEVLQVCVGGQGGTSTGPNNWAAVNGTGGYNGGGAGDGSDLSNTVYGGGGASDIRRGSYTLADRIVVAGGGGASGGVASGTPGAGGSAGQVGSNGVAGSGSGSVTTNGGPGLGATQSAGGAGGTAGVWAGSYNAGPGQAGSLGQGGTGAGGWYVGSGGGGGGYYGGGGGGGAGPNGAGGGSSYADPAATSVAYSTLGTRANGSVSIVYSYNLLYGTLDQEIASDNPLAYYPMSDTAAPYTDKIGTPANISVGGATVTPLSRVVTASGALGVDLTGGWLSAGQPTKLTPTSPTAWGMEACFVPDGFSANGNLIRADYTNNNYCIRYTSNGGIEAWVRMTSGSLCVATSAANVLVAGSKYHVFAQGTQSGGNVTTDLYVNGKLVVTNTVAGTIGFSWSQAVLFGTYSGSTEMFDGGLGQIAFYNAPLTATRIKAHYQATLTNNVPWASTPANSLYSNGLMVWYDVGQQAVATDNTAMSVLYDYSGNQRHANNVISSGALYRTNRTPSGRPSASWIGDGSRIYSSSSFNVGEGWTLISVCKNSPVCSQGTGVGGQGKRAKRWDPTASTISHVTAASDLGAYPSFTNTAWPDLTTTWTIWEIVSPSAGVQTIYINGVPHASYSAGTATIVTNMDSTASFGFGGTYMAVSAEYLVGEMSEFLLWDRALTDRERAQIRANLSVKHGITTNVGTFNAIDGITY